MNTHLILSTFSAFDVAITLPFLRPNDIDVVDFSFLPYDMDGLLVALFSLHTSVVSGELHAVDDFRDFDFVVAYIREKTTSYHSVIMK